MMIQRPDVLVLSALDDASVRLVVDHLPPCVEVLWWDDGDFPSRSRVSVTVDAAGSRAVLTTAGDRYDLGGVTVGWTRRPTRPRADDAVEDPSQRWYCEQVARYSLTGLWASLDARWLPAPPHLASTADHKIVALQTAAAVGLAIPPTVLTSDPEDLDRVWRELDGQVIAKTPRVEHVEVDGRPRHLFTHRIGRGDLLRRRSVRHAPLFVQPAVPKAVELRVTIVGDEVFAAELHTQESRRGRDDWRRSFGAGVRYRVHRLPDEVRERCLALTAALGLSFGALDLILTPDGDHVFLEVNAAGQWAWIEQETGLPISAAMAHWITQNVEARRDRHAA